MKINSKIVDKSILFLTGLPRAGKTALSKKLYENLKKNKVKVKNIDGDKFRKKITNRNYDDQSRESIGRLKIKEAIKYYDKGYFVIVSGVAYKKKWRKDLRKLCENRLYKEIYLKCSIDECIKRNMFLNKNEDLLKKKTYVYQEYKSFDLMIDTEYVSLYTSFNKISKLINVSK
jgi:adenylylsulfate kinase